TGAPLLVGVGMPGGRELRARIWRADVGRIPLLLLDSDIEDNPDDLRGVTDRLYGGDQAHRIIQEILAGIGGVPAGRAFCPRTAPQRSSTQTTPTPGAAGWSGSVS